MPHQLSFAVSPFEYALQFPDRIDDIRDLTWTVEEMVLNKHISVGQKDSEVGMRVVPADDPLVGILRIHFVVASSAVAALDRVKSVCKRISQPAHYSGFRRLVAAKNGSRPEIRVSREPVLSTTCRKLR